MSSWSDERRLNLAAEAAEKRKDDDAREERRLKKQAADDQRQRDLRRQDRDEQRAERAKRRLDRQRRRQARATRREKSLTPGNIYRRGTLALVTASAMASLPAQVMHFGGISHWLLPVPFALEGAAWVMAAGVAYADEKSLPGWVRWLLRGLTMTAAGYAAMINHQYGTHLNGLTSDQATTAGLGLAAVTLGGPLLFEIRQWVTTLAADSRTRKQRTQEKERARHEKERRKTFKDVTARADELMLAASYGTLTSEQAFDQAWQQVKGAPRGVAADWYADQLDAEAEMDAVLAEREHGRERLAVDALLADIFPPEGGEGGPSGATRKHPKSGPSGGAPEGRTALGGKGKRDVRSTSTTDADRPLAEADLNTVRKLAEALGGTDRLSAKNVRETVGCRNQYALRLRNAVRTEQGDEQ
jgi:hypothetical protein